MLAIAAVAGPACDGTAPAAEERTQATRSNSVNHCSDSDLPPLSTTPTAAASNFRRRPNRAASTDAAGGNSYAIA